MLNQICAASRTIPKLFTFVVLWLSVQWVGVVHHTILQVSGRSLKVPNVRFHSQQALFLSKRGSLEAI